MKRENDALLLPRENGAALHWRRRKNKKKIENYA